MTLAPSHLDLLEAEAIHIFREAAAQFRLPVLMYSIGKDSTVLLHLARKAFFPARLPFPLLHVDTTWKFREMIAFRDRTAARLGLDLIVHTNADGLARGMFMGAISMAVLSTLYGLLLANIVFAPLARAVERRAETEEDARHALFDWMVSQLEPEFPAERRFVDRENPPRVVA
jgi:hypothetical protein